jgi:hypothetical protein
MFAGILFLIVFFAIFYFIFFSKPPVHAGSIKEGKRSSAKETKVALPPVTYPKHTLLVVAGMVIAHQVFLFDTYFGIGWGIFAALASVALLLVAKKEQRTPLILSMTVATVIAAVGSTFRADGFIQSMNVAFVCVMLFLLVFFKTFEKISWNGIWLLKYGILMLPESIAHVFRVLQQSTSISAEAKKTSFSVMGVIKTSALTLIVLVVFIGILSNADSAFAQIIKDIWETAIARVLTGLLVAFVTVVLASMALRTKENEKFTFTFFSFWDVFMPVVAVAALFGLFLFIQYRYLFGNPQDLALLNLTYSEYVRKGFIELMWASFIGSLLAYFVYMKNQVLKIEWERQALKAVNVIFAAELVLLVASAFKRNLLYIDAFGLTRVRVVGNYFLVWLVGTILLLLAMALWNKMRERHFLTGVWILTAVVMLALNVVNIDKVVFASSPKLDSTKDFFYLASLSEDIAAEWVPMVDEVEQQIVELEAKAREIAPLIAELEEQQGPGGIVQQQFTQAESDRLANAKLSLIALHERWERLDKKYGSATEVKEKYYAQDEELPDWLENQRRLSSAQWGERNGYMVMAQNKQLYTERIPALLERVKKIQEDTKQDFYQSEYRLLYDYKRPFVSTEIEYSPGRIDFSY